MRIRQIAVSIGTCVVLGTVALVAGCTQSGTSGGGDKPRIAYVTNGIASFWVIAEKGVQAAAKDFDVHAETLMPPDGVGDQKRMVQDLLTRGIDGIAISPIDPANQTDLLNEVAANTNLITHDSDAPHSNRLCYIGMNNYDAGRMCGQLIKEALPDGGSIMLFVGRLEQLNAKLRRQGIIDELLDRDHNPDRFDAPGSEIRSEKYVVLDTLTDQFDFSKAKSLAQDAIARYPDLGGMVGLFAYNPPKILEAVKEAGKQGKIQVIGFDEDDETLQGIIDGHVHGTIVQDPYNYGYQSVRILAGLARGDKSVLPEGGFLDVSAQTITKENVVEFRDRLHELTKGASN